MTFLQQFAEKKGLIPKDSVEQLLKARADQDSMTGFLPDADAWDASLDAQIQEIMAGLPVSMENFNADLAARGLFSAGEAPKYLYANTIAPVMKAAATATAQAKLGYSQMYQTGAIASENAISNRIRDWYNWKLAQEQLQVQRQQIEAQKSASTWGGIGSFLGTGAGLLAKAIRQK